MVTRIECTHILYQIQECVYNFLFRNKYNSHAGIGSAVWP